MHKRPAADAARVAEVRKREAQRARDSLRRSSGREGAGRGRALDEARRGRGKARTRSVSRTRSSGNSSPVDDEYDRAASPRAPASAWQPVRRERSPSSICSSSPEEAATTAGRTRRAAHMKAQLNHLRGSEATLVQLLHDADSAGEPALLQTLRQTKQEIETAQRELDVLGGERAQPAPFLMSVVGADQLSWDEQPAQQVETGALVVSSLWQRRQQEREKKQEQDQEEWRLRMQSMHAEEEPGGRPDAQPDAPPGMHAAGDGQRRPPGTPTSAWSGRVGTSPKPWRTDAEQAWWDRVEQDRRAKSRAEHMRTDDDKVPTAAAAVTDGLFGKVVDELQANGDTPSKCFVAEVLRSTERQRRQAARRTGQDAPVVALVPMPDLTDDRSPDRSEHPGPCAWTGWSNPSR